jgi:single-strand DNA-binding protein
VAYELTGKIKLLQDEQTFSSGFRKRELVVIVEDGKYPQEINLEFVQDKIDLLASLQPGQEVTVTFDIRGREHNGRYYNNLQGWKIASGSPSGDYDDYNQAPVPPDYDQGAIGDDDIPF